MLTCDICGGKLVVMAGGIAACAVCGMEHSCERLQEKLAETKVTPPAVQPQPVDEDTSKLVEQYVKAAQAAMDASDYAAAELNADKVLRLIPEHAQAQYLKGKAVAWQSEVGSVRLFAGIESMECALTYASVEEKERLGRLIGEDIVELAKAVIAMVGDAFADAPSASSRQNLVKLVGQVLNTVSSLQSKVELPVSFEQLRNHIANLLNTAAITASDKADQLFGPTPRDKNQYAYRVWLEKTDHCIAVLEYASGMTSAQEVLEQVYDNLGILQQAVIDSCSYKAVTNGFGITYCEDTCLTNEAKHCRREAIARYRSNKQAKLDTLRKETARQLEQEHRAKVDAYWAEHADEKQALDAEHKELSDKRTQLQAQITALRTTYNELRHEKNAPLPLEQTEQAHVERIRALRSEQESLWPFQVKEKRVLQEQIDAETVAWEEVKAQIEVQREQRSEEIDRQMQETAKILSPFEIEMTTITRRLREIDKELSRAE